jgi:hypothetical protein
VEQNPEVGGLAETTNTVWQRTEPGGQSMVERREGTDHGDVAQLQSREKLRRVWRHRGRCRRADSCLQEDVRWGWKHGEPHGRLRGATNPQAVDAAQTVEAGRNGKDGTCSECGNSEPKVGRPLRERPTGSGRAAAMSVEGRSLKTRERCSRQSRGAKPADLLVHWKCADTKARRSGPIRVRKLG